jgi:hypothetical protein
MVLDLEIDEINAILNLMGEAPTARGFWPLLVKIKEQGDAQVPKAPLAQES